MKSQQEIQQIEEILDFYLDEDKVVTDKKLKVSVIRKIAPFYKFLYQENNQFNCDFVIEKIRKIINEEKSDIDKLLKYENLKSNREKVFQKFCKMINKFILKMTDLKVKDFGGDLFYMEIPDLLKERLKNIYTKINDYFEKNKELAYINK